MKLKTKDIIRMDEMNKNITTNLDRDYRSEECRYQPVYICIYIVYSQLRHSLNPAAPAARYVNFPPFYEKSSPSSSMFCFTLSKISH